MTALEKPASAAAPVLRVRGLRKAFGSNLVLDDLDLEADEHTCTALIGASGSGKSTLLRCIDLLDVVDDGVVELDGQDITDPRVDANKVRPRIGIVFQAFNLFPHLSVLDNITLAPRKVHRRAARGGRARGAGAARAGRAARPGAAPNPTTSPAGSSNGWRSSGPWRTGRG